VAIGPQRGTQAFASGAAVALTSEGGQRPAVAPERGRLVAELLDEAIRLFDPDARPDQAALPDFV
jgi:hypothetical protein